MKNWQIVDLDLWSKQKRENLRDALMLCGRTNTHLALTDEGVELWNQLPREHRQTIAAAFNGRWAMSSTKKIQKRLGAKTTKQAKTQFNVAMDALAEKFSTYVPTVDIPETPIVANNDNEDTPDPPKGPQIPPSRLFDTQDSQHTIYSIPVRKQILMRVVKGGVRNLDDLRRRSNAGKLTEIPGVSEISAKELLEGLIQYSQQTNEQE